MTGPTRRERDLLGERDVPADALWGIHSLRAAENFPLAGRPTHPALLHAYGEVKLACARVNRRLGHLPRDVADAVERACEDLAEGRLDDALGVDALQGGAGTSTNMNVNEVVANRAIVLLGGAPGDYERVHPNDHVNLHQSTNDTYPTALRIAALRGLAALEREVVALQEAFQEKERAWAGVVKVGRTQLQDAALVTLGREMGACAEAFARDRWRIYKCEERLRVVPLGGTAVGTGLGAPRRFIFEATEELRRLTGLGLARAENLMDATQNADVYVEASGILQACAADVLKVSGDLRLLASGPDAGLGEIRLPPVQAGSSIMPGKVNPVIPEAASQAAMRVFAHHQAITLACASGSLELNPFLPLVADALLDSLDLLARACALLRDRCVAGMEADEDACRRHAEGSTALATALLPAIGYARATEVARTARETGRTVRQVVVEDGVLPEDAFDQLVTPEAVTRLGHPDAPPPAAPGQP